MALLVCLTALVVLIIVLVLTCSSDDTTTTPTDQATTTEATLVSATYTADLIGANSVPPVETTAAATLTLTYDAETEELTFALEITKMLTSPRTATIYEGTPGTYGTAVYTLFSDPTNVGEVTGSLGDPGVILDENLIGPLRGMTVADLIALIKDGNAYVSVGNASHTDAIRGQIHLSD